MYHLRCIVMDANGGVSKAEMLVPVEAAELVAVIAGGDRKIFRDSSDVTLLDGTRSNDPDQCPEELVNAGTCASVGLRYAWGCVLGEGQRCRLRAGGFWDGGSGSAAEVLVGNVQTDGYETVRFTLTVSDDDGRRSSSSIIITLSEAVIDFVSVELVAHTANYVSFKGASNSGSASIRWNVVGPGVSKAVQTVVPLGQLSSGGSVDSDQLADPIPAQQVPAGWTGLEFVLDLTVQPSGLTPGARYIVSLDSSGGGSSSISFRIPLPPSGGSCGVSPLVGNALITEFTMSCSGWTAEELPLSYSFSVGRQGMPASSTPAASRSTFGVYLAKGTYDTFGNVFDSMGTHVASPAVSIFVNDTVVAPTSGVGTVEDSEVQAMDNVMERMAQLGQDSQLLQVAGSIITGLSGDTAARRDGYHHVGRRASSPAYRSRVRATVASRMHSAFNNTFLTSAKAQSLASSVSTLTNVPQELSPDAIMLSAEMLESSAQALDQEAVRGISLSECLTAANDLVTIIDNVYDTYMRTRLLNRIMGTVMSVSSMRIRTMLATEKPSCHKRSSIGMSMQLVATGGASQQQCNDGSDVPPLAINFTQGNASSSRRRQQSQATGLYGAVSLHFGAMWGGLQHQVRSNSVEGLHMYTHSGLAPMEACRGCVLAEHTLNLSSASTPLNDSSISHISKKEGVKCLMLPLQSGENDGVGADWKKSNCTVAAVAVDVNAGIARITCACDEPGLIMVGFTHPPTPNYTFPEITVCSNIRRVQSGIVSYCIALSIIILAFAWIGWICIWIRISWLRRRLVNTSFVWWTVADVWDSWDYQCYPPPATSPNAKGEVISGKSAESGEFYQSPRKPAVLGDGAKSGKTVLKVGDKSESRESMQTDVKGTKSLMQLARDAHLWIKGEGCSRRKEWDKMELMLAKKRAKEAKEKWWKPASDFFTGIYRKIACVAAPDVGTPRVPKQPRASRQPGQVTWMMIIMDWLEGEEDKDTVYERVRDWYRSKIKPYLSAAWDRSGIPAAFSHISAAVSRSWSRASAAVTRVRNRVVPLTGAGGGDAPQSPKSRTSPRMHKGGSKLQSGHSLGHNHDDSESFRIEGQAKADMEAVTREERLAEKFIEQVHYVDEERLEWIPEEVSNSSL